MESTYIGIGHGIKGANCQGVLIHDEKISLVLLLDNISELLFIFGAQVIVVILKEEQNFISSQPQ